MEGFPRGSGVEDTALTSAKCHFSRQSEYIFKSKIGDLISPCFFLSRLGQINSVCSVYKTYVQADVMIG